MSNKYKQNALDVLSFLKEKIDNGYEIEMFESNISTPVRERNSNEIRNWVEYEHTGQVICDFKITMQNKEKSEDKR